MLVLSSQSQIPCKILINRVTFSEKIKKGRRIAPIFCQFRFPLFMDVRGLPLIKSGLSSKVAKR